jgi:hypothetical protein
MKMTVKVQQKHIDQAMRGDLQNSPVSLALKEQVGGRWLAYRTFVSSPGYGKYAYVSVPLPKIARVFLQQFDYGEPVLPFTFVLHLPSGLEGRFAAIT